MSKVYCYGIKYTGKEAVMSCTGSDALANFVEHGYLSYYSGDEAPKDLTVTLKLPDNWLDDIISTEKLVKQVLEEDTGLKIEKFN